MNHSDTYQLKWVDALKAFAILGILFNHLVESFGYCPWFSNPEYNWPNIEERMRTLFPHTGNLFVDIADFFGWLGDMGPGVFILLSGFTLTLSLYRKNVHHIDIKSFYLKRYFRIWPLYFVIHIFITGLAILLGIQTIDPKSITYLISLTGFRFTEQLFFYINPSWWFIWLIFQLYFVFPFLYSWLKKTNIKWFILITLGITLLSRALGLFESTYSNCLYFWMTGLFFGTRLFEFTIGMALAKLLFEGKDFKLLTYGWLKTFIYSFIIYAIGFVCSLFWYTTLFSNILITIGMSGVLLGVWKLIDGNIPIFSKSIIWIGKMSFAVFLLHQPLMMWLPGFVPTHWKLPMLILIILISFPLGWIIEKATNAVLHKIRPKLDFFSSTFAQSLGLIIISLSIASSIIYSFTASALLQKAGHLGMLVTGIFAFVYLLFNTDKLKEIQVQIIMMFCFIALLFAIALPQIWFPLYWSFSFLAILLLLIIRNVTKSAQISITGSIVISGLIFLGGEIYLRKTIPIESGQWGEQPALQIDDRTIYSLIPNKETHLRYNNYDYKVKTNSLGFNSPELDLSHKEESDFRIFVMGDAFSMPEGMEYEKAYPFLLEQHLNKHYPNKNIQVINGGVTGYGPIEMLAACNKYIEEVKPDLVINQIFVNELYEINVTPEMRQGEIGLLAISKRKEIFERCQLPAFARKLSVKLNGTLNKEYRNQKSLIGLYNKSSAYYANENIKKMEEFIANLNSLCSTHSARLVILFAPGQLEISNPEQIAYYPNHINFSQETDFQLDLPTKLFHGICSKNGIKYLDPGDMLRSSEEQPVYFSESWHWNPLGHSLISEYLASEVSQIITENE